ncbi:MAG: methionine adenosyltransferase, partial [Lactobacillus sp.]|nr:methionine adenosyltransferase [Lactobacillus sp.]
IEETIRQTIKEIGYEQDGFDWKNVEITNLLHQQSSDIAMGVDNLGAGDQGIMFGYAKNEKGFESEYMPLAIHLSHKILQNLSRARHNNEVSGIEPDAKSQITLEYANNIPVGVKKIVVSTQHHKDLSQEQVREIVKKYIEESLPNGWMPYDHDILINPTGRFVIGGPDGDTGLTGRKIIVDTYGGYAPHGGGAFSGKDSTKVDRSAAYMLRYLAKNIVASGIADECLLQVSYAIGIKDPLSLYIDCKGTHKVDCSKILDFIKSNFDLTPQGIIKTLNLYKPIFTPTSSYGHFGRKPTAEGHFSWEKLYLVDEFKNACKA